MGEGHQPPAPDDAGFGRDKDLEKDRLAGRAAGADLNADEDKAEQRPTIDYAPDPDADADPAA